MGEKKVTFMVLKVVDLQCEKSYKKVKKVLCKFPQIRDQEYDEKNNLVKIKVVCCSPEKIRDKLCCKGGGAITSIEIIVPPPPPPTPPPTPPPPPPPLLNELHFHFHPPPLIITFDCYRGKPEYDSCSGGRTNYCVTRSDCFSEENPQACAIM